MLFLWLVVMIAFVVRVSKNSFFGIVLVVRST